MELFKMYETSSKYQSKVKGKKYLSSKELQPNLYLCFLCFSYLSKDVNQVEKGNVFVDINPPSDGIFFIII